MSFRLIELHRLDDSRDRHMAIVMHGEVQLTVEIIGQFARLQSLGQQEFTAEIEMRDILSVECNISKCDEKSGIFSEEDLVVFDGTVHQIMAIDEHGSLFDIYIRNGCEFFALATDELHGVVPILDTRLRLRGKGLQVFPTFV